MKEANFKETEIGKIPVDWEVKNFLDVFNFLSTANYSRAEVSENENTGYIHYGDIHTKFNFHLDLSKQISGFVSKEKQKNYAKIEIGDLIMADASEDYSGVGKSVEVLKLNKKDTISGLHTFLIRDKNKNFALGFKGYLHSNPLIKKQYDSLATGLKVFSLSKGCFQNIQIPLPPLAEQEKIAEVLSDTDLWIESTEALLAKKRQIKKGAMQKLLSPKEDWEVRKLGEVVKIKKGEQFNSSLLNNESPFPCYSGGIEPSGFSEKFNEDGNCIIISEGGNSCGFINFVKSKFWLGGHCYKIISIPKDFDQLFLYQLLKYNQTEIMGLRVGSGLPNIQKKAIENFEIAFPTSKQTQQEIAEILSSMDLEIESLENRLQKARQLKQGMMQDLLTGKVRLE